MSTFYHANKIHYDEKKDYDETWVEESWNIDVQEDSNRNVKSIIPIINGVATKHTSSQCKLVEASVAMPVYQSEYKRLNKGGSCSKLDQSNKDLKRSSLASTKSRNRDSDVSNDFLNNKSYTTVKESLSAHKQLSSPISWDKLNDDAYKCKSPEDLYKNILQFRLPLRQKTITPTWWKEDKGIEERLSKRKPQKGRFEYFKTTSTIKKLNKVKEKQFMRHLHKLKRMDSCSSIKSYTSTFTMKNRSRNMYPFDF